MSESSKQINYQQNNQDCPEADAPASLPVSIPLAVPVIASTEAEDNHQDHDNQEDAHILPSLYFLRIKRTVYLSASKKKSKIRRNNPKVPIKISMKSTVAPSNSTMSPIAARSVPQPARKMPSVPLIAGSSIFAFASRAG